jgi:Protein of unknown function (DUF3352)
MIEDVSATEPAVASNLPRWRIAVIGAVVVLAVAIGAVLGVTLTQRASGAGLSSSAGYVPADAVLYLEGNFDLNDSQRADLRTLIERFPGADADKLLTDALAQTLDDALQGAPFDYSNDIAPWFDGHAAVALLDLKMPADAASPQGSAVALFGVRDQAAATAFVDKLRTSLGGNATSTEVRGVTVWEVAATGSAMMSGSAAFAVSNDELLIGTGVDAITTALDVHAGATDSLANRSEVRDLAGHLPDGSVGVMTIDTEALLGEMRDALASEMPGMTDTYAGLLSGSGTFAMASVSFEADTVHLDSAAAAPTGDGAISNSTRDLADQVPADAMFFADTSDLGTRLSTVVTAMQAAMSASGMDPATMQEMESALGANLSDYVSWIGDGAVVAGYDGSQPYAGLVLEATDPSAAAQRMGQLSGLVQLATLDPSSGVTVSTDTVAGAQVTTLRIAFSGAPAFSVPGGDSGLTVQWAVDGDRVLIGVGDRFVGRVLQLDTADSLGATARFAEATGRFPGANAGTLFIDVAKVRDALAGMVPADAASGFAEADPVLSAFDYVVGDTRVESGVMVEHLAVVMK